MSTSEPANFDQSLNGDGPSTSAVNFYRQFLPAISEKTGAVGAVAWDCSSVPYKVIGQYVDAGKTVQINLSEQDHLKLLERSNDGQQAVLFAETSTESNKQTVALSPVRRQGAAEIVEIVFDDTMSEQARQQIGNSLASYCKAVDEFASGKTDHGAPATPQQVAANSGFLAIDNFAKSVHRSLDLKKTVFEIANELQAMVDCDRVAVFRKIGSRWKACAFSGQSELAARSNTIRELESLVGQQMKLLRPLWIPDQNPADDSEVESQSNQYKNCFDVYQANSGFKEIAIIPLRERPVQVVAQTEGAQGTQPVESTVESPIDNPIIGAIVLEQFGNQSFAPKRQGIQLLVNHAESAFQNSIAHQNLPFFGIVDRLGRLSSFRLRGRRNKLLGFLAISAVIATILAVVPTEFKIVADGVLLPEIRRNIFAEVDGEIDAVNVQHGAKVGQGDPLITLTSDQLKSYMEDLVGKIETTKKQIEEIDQARMRADQLGTNSAQSSFFNIERAKLQGALRTLDEEKKIADRRQEKLIVRSPIDGQVLSWQVDRRLENRPVTNGQRLLEIGDLEGPWIVEVSVPDKEVGKILMAQKRSKKPLKVTFMIVSDSSKSYSGEVVDIAKSTSTDPMAGQTAKVTVKINEGELAFRQVKTDVRAKIHCGQASVGYVWLHDLFEFVQSKVFFGLF